MHMRTQKFNFRLIWVEIFLSGEWRCISMYRAFRWLRRLISDVSRVSLTSSAYKRCIARFMPYIEKINHEVGPYILRAIVLSEITQSSFGGTKVNNARCKCVCSLYVRIVVPYILQYYVHRPIQRQYPGHIPYPITITCDGFLHCMIPYRPGA